MTAFRDEFAAPEYRGKAVVWARPTTDKSPRTQVQLTNYGFRYAAIRRPIKNSQTHDYVRITAFVAPISVLIPPMRQRLAEEHPRDDHRERGDATASSPRRRESSDFETLDTRLHGNDADLTRPDPSPLPRPRAKPAPGSGARGIRAIRAGPD